MSDILAAVGVVQLKRINDIIARKRELAEYWDDKLQDMELIDIPYESKDVKHIYQSYVTLLEKNINRNRVIEQLLREGIQTQIGTYASHIQPIYQSKDRCPNSLDVFNRALALPMYYGLTEQNIDMVANNLKKILRN